MTVVQFPAVRARGRRLRPRDAAVHDGCEAYALFDEAIRLLELALNHQRAVNRYLDENDKTAV
ncbi:MAG TPA: hypothetical protein VFA70_10180 [Dehalococcoidia bacterium]|nr:hypothetical protein [Dehalococcoidia bacterium]